MNFVLMFDTENLVYQNNKEIIFDRVKRCGDDWFYCFDGCFMIKTDKTAEEIYSEIKKDSNIYNFWVSKVNNDEYWGMMSVGLWEWLKVKEEK